MAARTTHILAPVQVVPKGDPATPEYRVFFRAPLGCVSEVN
jgi:hypothetical protein